MGDGGSSPSSFIAGKGQPVTPTITGNDGFLCMHQGLVKSGSCRGSMGKRRGPRPINHGCRCSGNGGPQTCLHAAHGVALRAGPYGPSSPTRYSRPSRGAKPREADDARPPQERPRQAGSRGAERSRQGTSRDPRDVSHDDRDQAGARRAPAHAVSLFPLWCQGGKRRRGVPRYQAKVSILVQ